MKYLANGHVNQDVPPRRVAPAVTEPFLCHVAKHNACWVMDATVPDVRVIIKAESGLLVTYMHACLGRSFM